MNSPGMLSLQTYSVGINLITAESGDVEVRRVIPIQGLPDGAASSC